MKKLFFAFYLLPVLLFAQKQPTSISKPDSARPKSWYRPYVEIIPPTAHTHRGLFTVHEVDDHWFLELPDSLLERPLLVVNRIAQAAAGGRADMLGYAGDEINENTITFSKGPHHKIFLKLLSWTEIANDSSENGMYRSVAASNLAPIAAGFEIKTRTLDSLSSVIEITDFVGSDNDILFFDGNVKKMLNLQGMIPDRSYIEGIRSFANNVEFRTVKTYLKVTNTPFGPNPPEPATYTLNSSLLLLPASVMHPRYFDARVGYFATGYRDFDVNPQGVEQTEMVTRWRLEPKDTAAYLRGELVEPVKPIVFYLDPSTPQKWVPFLIQGVEDWNKAFAKAGFKNVLRAYPAPLGDSTWDLEDAMHNAIVYKPSPIPNASGPHVHDPRSGEILETHINWYHNVMALLHNWYQIQAGAVDPAARKPVFDDALMGQLIRFVVSHEVGHTLGLRHNFGASSTVPVDSLRSISFLTAHGHTPSIMDYARFDYVAQPSDHLPESLLFPRIGAYDCWAIEWAYRWFPPGESREAERVRLNNWVRQKVGKDPSLWFGTESDPDDPRCQNEDLGDDPVKAGNYGIENLKRILPQLAQWTAEAGKGYDGLEDMYNELTGQYNRYLGHVAKWIGGIFTDPKTVEEKGVVVRSVPRERQQSAMQFLQHQLFTTPVWLVNGDVYAKTGTGDPSVITRSQNSTLSRLMAARTLDKLLRGEVMDPLHAYTCVHMLMDLQSGIWSELVTHRKIDVYRRTLQKLYTEKICALVNPPIAPTGLSAPGASPGISKSSDALSVVKGMAAGLVHAINASLPGLTDRDTRWHLLDCRQRLEEALHPKK